jgi:hypothetical protein
LSLKLIGYVSFLVDPTGTCARSELFLAMKRKLMYHLTLALSQTGEREFIKKRDER